MPSSDFKLTHENSAVSPVIGVILMVAITVILAAVIGSMVIGFADNLGEPAPTSNLQLAAVEDDEFIDFSNTDSIVSITHNGGNTIKLTEVEIRVEHATFDFTGATDSGTTIPENEMTLIDSSNSDINGGYITLSRTNFQDGQFNVGDVLFIEIENQLTANGVGEAFFHNSEGEIWTVQIIHEPSESIIFEDAVRVP